MLDSLSMVGLCDGVAAWLGIVCAAVIPRIEEELEVGWKKF
jgi:hypothetical protein